MAAKDAEPCAETRRILRRRSILRDCRKAALAAKPTNRQEPRATRTLWKARLSSAAKNARRQTKREHEKEVMGDMVLAIPEEGIPAVNRVCGSRRVLLTLKNRRMAYLEKIRRRAPEEALQAI